MDLPSLLALIQAGKLDEAIAVVKASPNASEASTAFLELSKQTYRDLHDVSSMIALADAGIEFALEKATAVSSDADAGQWKKSAEVLAFNSAANCWPGWDDPGVEIKSEHLYAGLKLAELCRNLTVELNLGPKPRGTAHWLIGALKLALSGYAEALAEFQLAKQEFRASGDSEKMLMTEGYAALVQKAQPQSREAGGHELDRILRRLESQNSKEGKIFANQIRTADRVLLSQPENYKE